MDLQNIPFAADENMGGVIDFRFADPALITKLGFPNAANSIGDATTFTGAGAWHVGYCTQDTGRFQETSAEGPGGTLYTHTFTCLVPGDSTTLRPLLEEMERHRCIYDVRDGNERWRRLGTLRNRPRLQYAYDSEGAAAGRAGYRLSITWQSERPAPFVEEHDGSGS